MVALPTRPSFKNLTGQRFGRLTVVEYAGNAGKNQQWKCECDCGSVLTARGPRLKSGRTKSCGCLQRDGARSLMRTHGMRYTPEYAIWRGIKKRCHNPLAADFSRYGGRGVTVCQEWQSSFAAFFAHVGSRPSPSHQIDRIDNERGYEPGNVRWATPSENQRNTRANRLVAVDGETLCVSEWSERTGIKAKVIFARLRRGWSIEKTLTTPTRA